MNRVRRMRGGFPGRDFIHNFFSRRLLVFCVFQFSILHYYADSAKQYAAFADYPAAPWILPFMGQNVYFQFVYGISVIYFYSNIPFLQRHEMYALMRQGKARWVSMKLLRVWLSAVALVAVELILSMLPLVPRLEWNLTWGKLYQSLALTDAGASCHVRLFFPYELLHENNALTTMLMLFAVLCLITGLTGTLMFALSVCLGRTAAIMAGTFLAVLTVVFENLYLWQPWIGFLSPFSWMNLLLLYGKVCRAAPSFPGICAAAVAFLAVAGAFSIKAVQAKDLNWIEEE